MGDTITNCDCEVYEICPKCTPSPERYEVAVREHNRIVEKMQVEERRTALESTIARTFVRMQHERNPSERQNLWAELLRLGGELEKLDDHRG